MARVSEEVKIAEAKLLLENNGWDVIQDGYLKCNISGRKLSVKQGNFYRSDSRLYTGVVANLNGEQIQFMPYSKTEIEKLYSAHSIDSKGDEKLAMYKLVQDLRIPWIESLWEMAESSKSASFKMYLSKFNSLPQYSNLTMINDEPYIGEISSITEENYMDDDFKLSKTKRTKLKKFWGKSFGDDDLAYLQSSFDDYIRIYPCDTPAQENGYKHIAKTHLLAERGLEDGNVKTYKDMMDVSSKLHNDLNIKPMQESGVNDNSKDSFGQFIQMIEETEPIPEATGAFVDVDGIMEYIQKWFVNHFQKIFGIGDNSEDILDEAIGGDSDG